MNSFMKIIGRRNTAGQDEAIEKGNYPAALRVTAPLLPSVALLATILAYLVSGEVAKLIGVTEATWEVMHGDVAVLGGVLIGILISFTVALFQNPYTSAYYVSRRNYNGLRERLDNLKIRVKESKRIIAEAASENGDFQSIRSQALALAERECEALQKGLESKGMPVVTGLAYIELWH